jgi:phosphoesterase RecJ-like protein
MSDKLDEILTDLKALKGPVAVIGHSHPDADCIGAAVGLAALLRALGIEAYATAPEPAPKMMARYLEGSAWVGPSKEFLKGKTIVAVDVAAKWMLEPVIGDCPVALAIDHHLSHEPFATREHIWPEATSVSEIVARLFARAGLKADTKVAEALYFGFLYDTGRWWWGGIGKGSFEMGIWLADCGVDFRKICDRLFGQQSLGHIRLLQRAFEKMEFWADGAIVVVALDETDFAASRACRYDKEGIVDALREIEGVQIAVLLNREQGIIKGSLRAHVEAARVDLLAVPYAGGGHKAAAGLGRGTQEEYATFLPTFRERALAHWESVKAAVLADSES